MFNHSEGGIKICEYIDKINGKLCASTIGPKMIKEDANRANFFKKETEEGEKLSSLYLDRKYMADLSSEA